MTGRGKDRRTAKIVRTTKETAITAQIDLDGSGRNEVRTPIGFLTHMLESFARHGAFDLRLKAKGDLEVDQHHTVEDCGLVLGQAFSEALGERRGIARSGYWVLPMDESLAVVAVDLGGRPYLQYDLKLKRRLCGDLDTDVLEDFFQGFASASKANIAIRVLRGRSDHHKIEAVFKAFARALRMACEKDGRTRGRYPSAKGLID